MRTAALDVKLLKMIRRSSYVASYFYNVLRFNVYDLITASYGLADCCDMWFCYTRYCCMIYPQ